jgi:GNAT superfamily N-acetyltransferase
MISISKGVAEASYMSVDDYKNNLQKALPSIIEYYQDELGFMPSKEQLASAVKAAHATMERTGDTEQAGESLDAVLDSFVPSNSSNKNSPKIDFKKNLLQVLQQKYPDAEFKIGPDRVESTDGQLSVIADTAQEGRYVGCFMWDVTTGPYKGALGLAVKQTTDQLLRANPGKKPALFIGGDNQNPEAWSHIAKKLKYKLITDEDELKEGFFDRFQKKQQNYGGIDVSVEKEDNNILVKATANGRELGRVLFTPSEQDDNLLVPLDLEVDERYRGQGIGATMYDYVKSLGYAIRRSQYQTDAGAGFWDKHKSEKNVWEQGVAEGIEFFAMPLRMSEYRGKTHPATNKPYDSKFKFSGDLKDRVHGLLDAGTKPTLLQVNPRHLLATQDWLSTQGGGKPPFATMKQHPVVLQKNNKLYILDGHHRSADAHKSGTPIQVYLFRDEL